SPQKNPSPALATEIKSTFGDLDSLKREINRAALRQFGSGWAWLVVTPDKKLVVSSTPNQDNPLMDIVPVRGIPILGIDVWEHAYYLHYQNRRGDYLGSIWNVIDWGVVSAKYDEAIASPLLKKLK
ncbi:MAG: Fe-Mn family superoxide dismutase, partial [Bacteroidales bacterium]